MTHRDSSTILSCQQAETELALQVGGDLDDPAKAALLRSHVENCPHCRHYQHQLRECLETLQLCAADSLHASRSISVWPRVAARLAPCTTLPAVARFNVWMPTTAIAAACAAMIFVAVVQVERAVQVDRSLSPQAWSVSDSASRDYFPQRFRDVNRNRPGQAFSGANQAGPVPSMSVDWGHAPQRQQKRFPSRGDF